VGYSLHQVVTEVLKWAPRGEGRVTLVLGQTPFYAESGGQLADVGHISNDAFEVRVTAVRKAGDLWLHDGELLRGTPDGAPVTAAIDAEQRLSTARNHTATHLLHAALREVLGAHVQQKGSLVSADRLRFDFTHYHQLTPRELEMVERIVNARVRDCLPREHHCAVAGRGPRKRRHGLFDENTDEQVRVVSVEGFSASSAAAPT
jgi:alanyl-tRNA synthetase